jgi:hypothetical protein
MAALERLEVPTAEFFNLKIPTGLVASRSIQLPTAPGEQLRVLRKGGGGF